TRSAPVEDRRLAQAQRMIGELAMELDILRGLVEEMGRLDSDVLALLEDDLFTSRRPSSAARTCGYTAARMAAAATPSRARRPAAAPSGRARGHGSGTRASWGTRTRW